jgi:hypothetical protein
MIEERKKESRNRKDHWLHEGIVVKVRESLHRARFSL